MSIVTLSNYTNITGEITFDLDSRSFYFSANNNNVQKLFAFNVLTEQINEVYTPERPWILKKFFKTENKTLLLLDQNNRNEYTLWLKEKNKDLTFIAPSKNSTCKQAFLTPDEKYIIYNLLNKEKGISEIYLFNTSECTETLLLNHKGLISIQDISPNGNYIALFLSNNGFAVNICIIDLSLKKVVVNDTCSLKVKELVWDHYSEGFYILTNELSDFSSVYHINLSDFLKGNLRNNMEEIYSSTNDVERIIPYKYGELILLLNVKGYSRIMILDKKDGFIFLPINLGVISTLSLSKDSNYLIYYMSSINSPSSFFLLNMDTYDLKEIDINAIKKGPLISFNEYQLSSHGPFFNIYSSENKNRVNLPVVIYLHGGPHTQDRPEYSVVRNFVIERGYTILSLNYHGSTGYGKKYEESIIGEWGNKDLNDIKCIFEWLKDKKWVDKNRIIIAGESYGGYLALLAALKLDLNFSNVIAISCPVNLIDFIENMPKETQLILKENVGDITLESKRKFLLENSPNTYVKYIKSPILLAHGELDHKINVQSIKQFVRQMTDYGNDILYLPFENEGHSISDKNNLFLLLEKVLTFI